MHLQASVAPVLGRDHRAREVGDPQARQRVRARGRWHWHPRQVVHPQRRRPSACIGTSLVSQEAYDACSLPWHQMVSILHARHHRWYMFGAMPV